MPDVPIVLQDGSLKFILLSADTYPGVYTFEVSVLSFVKTLDPVDEYILPTFDPFVSGIMQLPVLSTVQKSGQVLDVGGYISSTYEYFVKIPIDANISIKMTVATTKTTI